MAQYRVIEAVACEELDGSGTNIHLRLAPNRGQDVAGWRAVLFLPTTQHPAARSRVNRDLAILGVTWDAIATKGEQAFVGATFNGEACGSDWVAIRERASVLV